MIIDCISDLHGYYPKLEGGDLLIVAGDLTASDKALQHLSFIDWLCDQKYKKKIFILGNHDNTPSFNDPVKDSRGFEYLCDSGTEFEGFRMWGSPHSLCFPGINPKCSAFTGTESDLQKKFDLIPNDIDILITHSPPYMILDEVKNQRTGEMKNAGSIMLRNRLDVIQPCLHVFGHIHEHGGRQVLYKHAGPNTICVNASIVNENYEHVNKPIRIVL